MAAVPLPVVYTAVFLVHFVFFLPLCTAGRSTRFHALWMAAIPTLFVVAFTTDPFRGPLAVMVAFTLIVGGMAAVFGWFRLSERIAQSQPFPENSWLASGEIGRLFIGFLLPGLSIAIALAILFSIRVQRSLGYRVFVEPNQLPMTLESDPRRRWLGGAFLLVVVGLLVWNDLKNAAGPETVALVAALVCVLPWIAMRRQHQIDLTPNGIDMPRFPVGRRFVRYADIESAAVGSFRFSHFIRLQLFGHADGPTTISLGSPVENLSDLVMFIEKRACEARSVLTESTASSSARERTSVFDVWTISLLIGFNGLAVGIPLYKGAAFAAALIALFIAFIAQTVALPLALFADSARKKRENLMFALAFLYFALFKFNGLLEFKF